MSDVALWEDGDDGLLEGFGGAPPPPVLLLPELPFDPASMQQPQQQQPIPAMQHAPAPVAYPFVAPQAAAIPEEFTSETAVVGNSSGGSGGSGGESATKPRRGAASDKAGSAASSSAAAAAASKVPRKKLWKCTYPGCNEPCKTHYNAHSHVWDAHVRHELGAEHPLASIVYKKLPDRGSVKKLCQRYLVELADDSTRATKRRRKQEEEEEMALQLRLADSTQQQQQQQQQQQLSQQQQQQHAAAPSFPGDLQFWAANAAAEATAGTSAVDQGQSADDEESPDSDAARRSATRSFAASSSTSSPSTLSPSTPSDLAVVVAPSAIAPALAPAYAAAASASSEAAGKQPSIAAEAGAEVPVRAGVRKEEQIAYALDPNEIVQLITLHPGLQRLHVAGEVFAEHGFLQRSDARFKEEIRPIRGALERVLNVSGRTFRYIGDDRTRMGFIAQELQDTVPSAVIRDERGLSVDVVSLVPLILEALKDLHQQTSGTQSAQASEFRAALSDAMERVNELDAKLSCYRTPATTPAPADEPVRLPDDDEEEEEEDEDEDEDEDELSLDTEEELAMKRRRQRKKKQQERKKNGGTQPTSMAGRLHYTLTFGPPAVVLFFALVFLGSGVLTFLKLPKLPFVWGFCFFTAAFLGMSLFFQWREVLAIFKSRGGDIRIYWKPSHTINVFVLTAIGLIGATLTLIMGTAALYSVSLFGISLFILWGFSVVLHNKWDVRINTILVAFLGLFVLSAFLFAILFLAQPYQCKFEGYDTLQAEVSVVVGQSLEPPLTLNPLPFNCFFPGVETAGDLPPGLNMNANSTPPAVSGTVEALFNRTTVSVTLVCSGYQRYSCGSVTFSACTEFGTEMLCRANSCSWCPPATENETGRCGQCDQAFEDKCLASTGQHSSCFGQIRPNAAASRSALLPFSALVFVALALLI